MADSPDIATVGTLPTDSGGGRTSKTASCAGDTAPDITPAGGAGRRKSYIGAGPAR
jgi:hypothetical protein